MPRITRQIVLISLLLIALGALVDTATADPRNTAVRHTIIVTGDMEASIHFYRDLLGFVITFDHVLDNPDGLALLAPGAISARAVTLKHPSVSAGLGTIGLYEYDFIDAPATCDSRPRAGGTGMLFLTDDMQGLYDKLTAAGARPVAPTMSYDQREGRGNVNAFSVYDPNCMRIVFAQLTEEAFEESIKQ